MRNKSLLASMICGIIAVPVFAVEPAVPAIAPAPAGTVPQAVAPPQAGQPGPLAMDDVVGRLPLRKLKAVQDARERLTDWQKAADQAMARVKEEPLKQSIQKQLAQLAPQLAHALLKRPGQSAMVTVAVYKERDGAKQALAAVAYEGLGDQINPSFLPRVLANFPQIPGANAEQAGKLELDVTGTSYLCFYLDHGDLKAGDITHAQLKKSLDLAIQQARRDENDATAAGGAGAGAQAALDRQRRDAMLRQADLDRQLQQARDDQRRQDNAQQAAARAPGNDGYVNPYWNGGGNPYYGTDGWVPWVAYVPGAGYSNGNGPVIVQPDYSRYPNDHSNNNQRPTPTVVAPAYLPNTVAQRDPRTGQPITPQAQPPADAPPGASVPSTPVAQRDPQTGQPITPGTPGSTSTSTTVTNAPSSTETPAERQPVPARTPVQEQPVQRPTPAPVQRPAPGPVQRSEAKSSAPAQAPSAPARSAPAQSAGGAGGGGAAASGGAKK